MPLLIDGNNLLHHLDGGASTRADVRRQVLAACRAERMRVTVVFDGPPPAGTPPRELLGPVTVIYSGSETADDVITRLIPEGSGARDWVVVTDDRGLGARARQRGAEVRSLRQWQRRRSPPSRRSGPEPKLSSHEIADWENYFAGRGSDDEDPP